MCTEDGYIKINSDLLTQIMNFWIQSEILQDSEKTIMIFFFMFVEDFLRPTSSRFAATTLLLCVKTFVVKKVSTIVTFVVSKLSEDILSAPHKLKGVLEGSAWSWGQR